MNMTLLRNKITIIGAYAMNDDFPVNKKKEFFEQLLYEI